jgi:hypothetical protein
VRLRQQINWFHSNPVFPNRLLSFSARNMRQLLSSLAGDCHDAIVVRVQDVAGYEGHSTELQLHASLPDAVLEALAGIGAEVLDTEPDAVERDTVADYTMDDDSGPPVAHVGHEASWDDARQAHVFCRCLIPASSGESVARARDTQPHFRSFRIRTLTKVPGSGP